jgi:hypothetical protein
MAKVYEYSELVRDLEKEISSFYDFELQAHAHEHLIDRQSLEKLLPNKKFTHRAGVVFEKSQTSEFFIGIFFDESLFPSLNQDPREKLTNLNLDSFCVLVEEISHFHLVLNRACDSRSVSKLELEIQGEIDKLLFSSLILERQSGKSQMEALFCTLFDMAKIQNINYDLYWQATKLAARYWENIIRGQKSGENPFTLQELQKHMRMNYRLPLSEKFHFSSPHHPLVAA